MICHNTWTRVHYSWMNTQLSRDSLVSVYFLAWFGCLWVLRREVRTCASHCDYSLHLYHPALLIRHLHIILKSKNTKYTVDQAATSKTFVFVTWPTVARPQTGRIPYTKQSWANWERWLGRIPCCCCLRISRPQHNLILEVS